MVSLVIGLCAGVLCTLSFFPQVMRIYKTKRVGDLSLVTFSVLSAGIFLWLIYGILTSSLPIMLTNGAMLILSLLIVVMIVKYK